MIKDDLKNLIIQMSPKDRGSVRMMDTLHQKCDDLKKDMTDTNAPITVRDSYGNAIKSIGTDDKIKSFTSYGFENDTLNFPLWMCLYNDSWVFRKAIDKPSQDIIRVGFTLNGDSDFESVYKDVTKLKTELTDLLKWGSLFGGAVAVIMFDTFNDEDYSNETCNDKIKNAKTVRLYVTDRWYGVQESDETVTDMESVDYGKPEFYIITFSDGRRLKVNHNYVLRYEHRSAPRLIKDGALQGWGYAEGAHILNELARDDDLKASISSLVNKSLIEVIKMAGMRGLFMGNDDASKQQIESRLEMVNWARSYNALTFLDKDDDYQQNEYGGLSGLSDLLDTNMKLVASAIDMPGILFGDLKDGMGNDKDALERYDQVIQDRADSYYRPSLTKLLKVLFIKNGIDEKIEFTFNSLLTDQRDKDKLDAVKSFQELLSNMLQDGIINTTQYAKSMRDFALTGRVDFNITGEDLENLETQSKEESEDFNFDEDNEGDDKTDLKEGVKKM